MEIFSGSAYYLLKRFAGMIDLKQYLNESLLDDFDTIANNQDVVIWIESCEAPHIELDWKFENNILYIGKKNQYGWGDLNITRPIPDIIHKIVITNKLTIRFLYKVNDPDILSKFETVKDDICICELNNILDGIKVIKNTILNNIALHIHGNSVKFINCEINFDYKYAYPIVITKKSKQKIEDLMGLKINTTDDELNLSFVNSKIGNDMYKWSISNNESDKTKFENMKQLFEKWMPNNLKEWCIRYDFYKGRPCEAKYNPSDRTWVFNQ